MKAKVEPQPELADEPSWLATLWRKAGAPVRSEEAPIPVKNEVPMRAVEASISMAGHPLAVAEPTGHRVTISLGLRARAERIVHRAQVLGLPVFPVAIAPLFAGWRLHAQGQRYDYVFCNLAEDPLFRDRDGFPIPEHTLGYLQQLSRTSLGKQFDLLYAVHEVEKGTVREGEDLEPDRLVPPSSQVHQASRRLGSLGTGLWLGAALPLLAGAGLGVTAAMAGLAMTSLGLDPLLLGAVVAPQRPIGPGELAIWFYLAHWRYVAK